jgi:hypothetical protein
MNNWISVKERLPEKDLSVLVYAPHNEFLERKFWVAELVENIDNNKYWDYTDGEYMLSFEDVTHWQPLPEPPKK